MSGLSQELDRIARDWNIDVSSIDGLEAIVEGVGATYARVEALAAETLDDDVEEVRWQAERVAGGDPHHAWMYRTRMTAPAADGPLSGLRLVVKDSIAVAGVPMTGGSDFLRDFVPRHSAIAVRRALDAGATLAGTAVCENLCYSGSSFTSATGPVLNPYDRSRSAGGSTSGCGVLLATGEADIALGTDLGGSVRNPAAWCGVYGLKATFGVVPYTGALPTEFSMDHLGLMARRIEDLRLLLDAVAGADPADPRQAGVPPLAEEARSRDLAGLRIGIVRDGFGWPERSDPRVDEGVRRTAMALGELLGGADEVSIPLHRPARDFHVPISCEGGLATVFDQNAQGSNYTGRYDPDLAEAFGNALASSADRLPLNAKASLIAGTVMRRRTKGRVMALAHALRAKLRQQVDAALDRYDVLVMPTVPMLPHRLPDASITPAEYQRLAFEMHDNNCAFNLTGHPALSVPCGLIDGLPYGMLLIGRHLDDHLLLRVAEHIAAHICPPTTPATVVAV